MAKQPFISHAVNGYSRYDLPESKAFSCTPGILYPVRIDFINARDRVTIDREEPWGYCIHSDNQTASANFHN